MRGLRTIERAFIPSVTALGLGLLVVLLGRDLHHFDNPLDFSRFGTTDLLLFLIACALLTGRNKARLSSGISLSLNAAAMFAAVLSLPAGLAALVAVLGLADPLSKGQPWVPYRYFFILGDSALSFGIGALVLEAGTGHWSTQASQHGLVFIAIAAGSFLTVAALTVGLTSIGVSIGLGLPKRLVVTKTMQESALAYPTLPAFGAVIAYLVHDRQLNGILLASVLVLGLVLQGRLLVGAQRGRKLTRNSAAALQAATGPETPLETVVSAVAAKGLDAVNADECLVFILEGPLASLRAQAPRPIEGVAPVTLERSGGLLATVLRANAPVGVSLAEDPREFEGWLGERGLTAALATALRGADSRVLGMVVVGRKDGPKFRAPDYNAIIDLSDEVATALSSGDLVARAQKLSALEHRVGLAREVHDRLAGDLSTASALFKFYEQEPRDDQSEGSRRTLTHIKDLVDQALRDSRDILSTLRPGRGSSTRLESDVREIAKNLSESFGVKASVDVRGDTALLSVKDQEAVYWIIREAVANVRRHASASNVQISLDLGENTYRVLIKDDGAGIDLAAAGASPSSFGIAGMRERASRINATLCVERGPVCGTTVSLTGRLDPGARA